MFRPEHFFDLSSFSHRALFDGCEYVWQALNNIDTYLSSQKLGVHEGVQHPDAWLVNPELISIGPGSVIEPGAYVQGPCIIGSGCQIRHGAYIRGNCIIGDGAVIGHTTEIKNSIVFDRAHAAHFAYVGDSILGSGVNLGAGVKCANLCLHAGQVFVRYNGEKIATGRRKFGAIIGDFSQIGCNTVLNPGTLLSKEVHVFPGVCVSGYVEEAHQVINAQKPLIKPRRGST